MSYEPNYAINFGKEMILITSWQDFKPATAFNVSQITSEIPILPGIKKSDITMFSQFTNSTEKFEYAFFRGVGYGNDFSITGNGNSKYIGYWIHMPLQYTDKQGNLYSGMLSLFARALDSSSNKKKMDKTINDYLSSLKLKESLKKQTFDSHRKLVQDQRDKQQLSKELNEEMEKSNGQSKLLACQGSDTGMWTNCVGNWIGSNGDKYVGEFKDNKYDGRGTYTYANGEKYVGEFKDNKYDGRGIYYSANGSIKESGIYKDNLLVISPRKTNSSTRGNKLALVIGNDSYMNIGKLKNAREDAKTMAENLQSLNYKVTLKLDVNQKEMKSTIRNFANSVQGGDEVVIFYAGHGVQIQGANYLLPIDLEVENETQVKDDAVQLQRILDDMANSKARLTLAIIDACRNNPLPQGNGRTFGGRGLATTNPASGQMIIFSAGSGQEALDKLGKNDISKNDLFTRIFVTEMKKPGLTVDRILRNVRKEVVEKAKSINHEQTPAIYDQVVGDFYFNE
jgi:hypothetical protein